MIIGGAEDREGEKVILRRFVELSGGDEAQIAIIGTATTVPGEVGPLYLDAFDDLGAGCAQFLSLSGRREANSSHAVDVITQATGVFFTGGDQSRIASVLGGSRVDSVLHERHKAGQLVIAGTSAGAAMMSSTMILRGGDLVPSMTAVQTGPGLGFVEGVVIDMHFAERGRLSRLLAAVALRPQELGIGIDEDTALEVDGSVLTVLGRGAVTLVDASQDASVMAPAEGREGPIALTGVRLHVLPSGYTFNLSTRHPQIIEAPENATDRSAPPAS
ncbi:MAG TPA: cyanophycinase [Acidimicrobiales bacterium]|nr:cyanophycinase [Acidimicrobiales bacterium]